MVEYTLNYDNIFHALADQTRRDILRQVIYGEKTISEIAQKYSMSFAAIAKHLNVLEAASLIVKKKHGRTQVVAANPQTIASTTDFLKQYERMWDQRFNNLERILKEEL
jgi:DNA-binding transcriptional ArsR family regulator